MTRDEEKKYYEQNKESNLQFIRAKLPHASPRELGLMAAFIRGLAIDGWSEQAAALPPEVTVRNRISAKVN